MNIATAIQMIQLIRQEVDADMSVQRLHLLLVVLSTPSGIDQSTLLKRVDQSRSAVSKNIADLSSLTSRKTPGPNLIRSDADPMNLSTRIIVPTDKGIALAKRISKTLEGVRK